MRNSANKILLEINTDVLRRRKTLVKAESIFDSYHIITELSRKYPAQVNRFFEKYGVPEEEILELKQYIINISYNLRDRVLSQSQQGNIDELILKKEDENLEKIVKVIFDKKVNEKNFTSDVEFLLSSVLIAIIKELSTNVRSGKSIPISVSTYEWFLINSLIEFGFNADVFTNSFVGNSHPNKMDTQSDQDNQPEPNSLLLNLNELAKKSKIDRVICRDDEMLKMIEILGKRKKNNPVILGDAGVGKTALAESLAVDIVKGNVPKFLKNAVVYNLQIGQLTAGSSMRGQLEEKVLGLISQLEKEAESGKSTPIIFIDEIHSLGQSNGAAAEIANLMKPTLSRGVIRFIGATTEKEWNSTIRHDAALRRRFDIVSLKEPSKEKTLEILKHVSKEYAKKHKVTYSEDALKKSIDLSIEFITDSFLPDKAINLIDYAGSVASIKGSKTVDDVTLCEATARLKCINLDAVSKKMQALNNKRVPLDVLIKKELFGQDHCIKPIVANINRFFANLGDADKPIGSFLLLGPTGVGKTELAKLVAKNLNIHYERIDMSEYKEAHTLSNLLGSPSGYVGFGQGGRLTQVLQQNPHCVLLFDEVEKAHPDVIDILLQGLDRGIITDRENTKLSLRNAIVFATSNLGARELQSKSIGMVNTDGKIDPSAKAKSDVAVKNHFRPEQLARFSAILDFNSLDKTVLLSVVDKCLVNTNNKLLEKSLKVVLTDSAKQFIVDYQYDPSKGARPIEKKVKTLVEDLFIEDVIYNNLSGLIEVFVDGDKLSYRKI